MNVHDYIEREAAIAIIEEKQKELCPVGMYSRHAVYGSDREKFDAWEEIIEALESIPAADVVEVRHAYWRDIQPPDRDNNVQCWCSACGAGGLHADGMIVPSTVHRCFMCSAELDAENRSGLIKGETVMPLCKACADAYVEWLIKDNERRQKK